MNSAGYYAYPLGDQLWSNMNPIVKIASEDDVHQCTTTWRDGTKTSIIIRWHAEPGAQPTVTFSCVDGAIESVMSDFPRYTLRVRNGTTVILLHYMLPVQKANYVMLMNEDSKSDDRGKFCAAVDRVWSTPAWTA